MVYDIAEGARGRGAHTNATGRYEPYQRVVESDGWDIPEVAPTIRTEVSLEAVRKAINKVDSPDLNFDRSVNPYRGCEHGCVYCFARPSHTWLGMSAGLDFETKLIARPNVPDKLLKEISSKNYKPKPIAFGTNTDPYQPIEKEHKIMRRCLEILEEFQHPLTITTKGTLIERDIDILERMAKKNLVQVGVSVTTLDAGLSRRLEPRVPSPLRRLGIIKRLSDTGVPVRVMASPLIPGLTDFELEKILEAGSEAGAVAASWIILRLPFEVAELFKDWLAEHAPLKAARVIARVRDAHGGKDYDATFGKRQRGEGHYAQLIAHRFKLAARRNGLSQKIADLDRSAFRVPIRSGDQLSLF